MRFNKMPVKSLQSNHETMTKDSIAESILLTFD